MNFDTKKTIQSEVADGVSYVVRNLNKIQRAKRDAKLVEPRFRISQMYDRMMALSDGKGVALEGNDLEFRKLDNQIGNELSEFIHPAYIRAGLVSITGYSLNGTAATVDTLIESGEDALLDEIYAACLLASGLIEEQKKNSQSPSISVDLVDGSATPTSATPASV